MNRRLTYSSVFLILLSVFLLIGGDLACLTPLSTPKTNVTVGCYNQVFASGRSKQTTGKQRRSVKSSVKSGAREIGHSVKGGVKSVGRSIKKGGKAVGHSVKHGTKKVGHFFRDIFK
jgi:riboflavin synthase alpha subunit